MAVEVNTMEVKKTQQLSKPINAQVKEPSDKAMSIRNFVGNMKGEFAKISWTSPDELRSYTKIVVATTFFFGMGIYVMDLAIQTALNVLEFLMRLVS